MRPDDEKPVGNLMGPGWVSPYLTEFLEQKAAREAQPCPPAPALGCLDLTCSKCTKYSYFFAETRSIATNNAMLKGWKTRGGKVICPKCK